jgi:hypothetical protein
MSLTTPPLIIYGLTTVISKISFAVPTNIAVNNAIPWNGSI